jgi:glycosyltransferase involved in cell wall biosynthesis
MHVVTYHLGQSTGDESYTIHRIADQHYYRKVSPGPAYSKLLCIDPLLSRKLAGVLREQRFDLLHAHHFEGLLVALTNRTEYNLPVVFDAHTLLSGELHHYQLGLPAALLKKAGAFLDRNLSKRADRIIAVSEEIRDWLTTHAGIDPRLIRVIPNGVEQALFEIHLPQDVRNGGRPTRLVYAGNLAPYQGIDILLQAFGLVRQRTPSARLQILSSEMVPGRVIAGIDPGIRHHIELVETGFGELPARLGQADLLLNPRPGGSGFPLKLLNYMAAGRPIVSFSGSGRGLVHGETAWLVEGSDPQDFADGILHLLENPHLRQSIGEKARNFAQRNYSWKRTGEQVLRLYQQVLDG